MWRTNRYFDPSPEGNDLHSDRLLNFIFSNMWQIINLTKYSMYVYME